MTYIDALNIIVHKILCIRKNKSGVLRIAINGIEGTGKTTFAIDLNKLLIDKKQDSLHISIDGFHNPKEIRYKKGRNSAIGYYEDSYNEKAFVDYVLISSKNKQPYIVEKIYDIENEILINEERKYISPNAIIITDGAYLFKDIYVKHWDFKIYLKSSFANALKRAIIRDQELLGGIDNTIKMYIERYHKSSEMYIQNLVPEKLADIILDFNDLDNINIV